MDWRDMSDAPRDGSIIEVENRRGYPWSRRLVFWTDEVVWPDGRRSKSEPRWADHRRNTTSADPSVWRPFFGDAVKWSDPYDGFDAYDFYRGRRPWMKLVISDALYMAKKVAA